MQLNIKNAKGFTLIELLVVIAIVAILSVVVILTLNPAQLLAQARDSNRISDLNTLKSALSLYLSDVSSPDLGTDDRCYVHASSGITSVTCGTRHTTSAIVTSTGQGVNSATEGSTGNWLPVNFSLVSGGAPIGNLPKDPSNTTSFFYSYAPDITANTFKLEANMESSKYVQGGGSDAESTDGGASTTAYEVGTDMAL